MVGSILSHAWFKISTTSIKKLSLQVTTPQILTRNPPFPNTHPTTPTNGLKL